MDIPLKTIKFVKHMKPGRTTLFIAISSIALCAVLFIQVRWIFETARIKEELFNEKANLVLSKTADALNAEANGLNRLEVPPGKTGSPMLDSLFNRYMEAYNIKIAYFFELKKGPATKPSFVSGYPPGFMKRTEREMSYQTCLADPADEQGMILNLVFPGKNQFILAEMGSMFITSVILVIVVLVMSWWTIRSLLREKRISEHATDFLNNMTHEFKTPLTNIALAGRMISRDTGAEDKVLHYSGIILEENEKLRLQVEQVLSMTALERGEIPVRKTELDMHMVINDALKCMSLQIEDRKGRITQELAAGNPVISGDRTHLTNTVCSLLDNAIKFSPGQPELRIETKNSNGYLRISITDKGPGIEKQYHKKIFNKFFRVPSGDVHDAKGFGLGLAYIKKIIELHGAAIDLQSEKNKGSTFTITIHNA